MVLIGPVYPYRGGIAHFTTMLGHALEEEHDLRVISFRRQYPRWLYPGKTDRDPSAHPLTIPAEFLLDPLKPWTWIRTARCIRQWGPSVVVIQWWTTFWAPALGVLARLLRREDRRILFLAHNVIPHEPRPWDRPLARFALSGGTTWVVMSAGQRALLQEVLPGAVCQLCAHPAYQAPAGRVQDRPTARRDLGIPSDAETILFFGLVRPYKGLGDLLRAVEILHRQGRPVHLVIAGEFWENRKRYLARIAELGIGDCTLVHDKYIPDEEIGTYFLAADVLAAPYRGGSQSGVVQLAAGYGLPCVVSSGGPDARPGSEAALITASAGDPPALARAVSELLDRSERAPNRPRSVDREWAAFVQCLLTATS